MTIVITNWFQIAITTEPIDFSQNWHAKTEPLCYNTEPLHASIHRWGAFLSLCTRILRTCILETTLCELGFKFAGSNSTLIGHFLRLWMLSSILCLLSSKLRLVKSMLCLIGIKNAFSGYALIAHFLRLWMLSSILCLLEFNIYRLACILIGGHLKHCGSKVWVQIFL